MRNDKRKSRRQPLRYSAWMAIDNEKLRGCMLSDISETGARIDVDDTAAVPDHFILQLAGGGSARRNCRVVWRTPKQIGVAFAKHLDDPADATLAPEAHAGATAATEPVEST
jgi:hypothetical protein